MKAIIASDLGEAFEEIFEDIDATPMACASIAQVHRATLKSGESCVVKIVRPQVRERLAADFEGISLVARLGDLLLGEKVVRSFVSHSLEETVHRLRCAVLSEADMSNERGNLEAFRQWLALSTTLRRANLSECIHVPKTFAQASSKRVLTMERIDGKPLSEIWQEDSHEATMDTWQSALVNALTVAAMSVIDDEGIFMQTCTVAIYS